MLDNRLFRNLKKEGDFKDFYTLEEDDVLGEGASAIVKKATKIATGESFAIKVIDKMSLTEIDKENLEYELKIMGMIDHPNIVQVFEYYDCHGIIFIVMELMKGGQLYDRIADLEHYTEKQAADAFRQIVDAVRYCHSLGIVHRDLKPENLLYTTTDEDATLKVSDFGFAKFCTQKDNDKLYTACGTSSYLAPDIIKGGGYDNKVDCWSLGVILYVMLCGYPPFYSENQEELFKLILDVNYEFHMPNWGEISDNAKDLIKKLLVADPKVRLSTDEILKHPWLTENASLKPISFKEDYNKYKKKFFKNIYQAKNVIDTWTDLVKTHGK